MINDSILAKRLNLYREGKIDEFVPNDSSIQENSKISDLLALAFKTIDAIVMFIHSLAFGFTIKTIFATDWNFLTFLIVGFTIEIITSNIFSALNKNK